MPSYLSAVLRPRQHAKHAKPSRALPALAAGGLTLALAATDVALTSTAASAAAPDAAWDRLAACESGGNWAINTGNGYYGGLQFNAATWRGVGGVGLPHQASRQQQIAAANRLHDARGFQPWPACSRKLGLRGNGGAVAAAPAPAPAAAPAPAPAPVAAPAPAAAPAVAVPPAPGVALQAPARASRSRSVTTALAFSGRTMSTADRRTFRADVRDWQQQMRNRGWRISVDGLFGPQSAAIAARFAAQKGLTTAPGTVDAPAFAAAWTAPTR